MTSLTKPTASAPLKGRREHYDVKVVISAFILIAPTIIGLCVLNVYPFFDTIRRSLYKTQGLGPEVYVGVQNYVALFKDDMIRHATVNTLLYMLLTVPVGVMLSLIFASFLNSRIRGRDIYRGIYFLPMVVAPAAVAMVWRWIFNTENGILNLFLKLFGIQGPSWLSDPKTALLSCAIIGIWSSIGYDLVMILAGLQSISRSYYEAAQIDGASGIQSFWHITIPMVSPTLFFVVLMRAMTSLKQFDTVYMLIKSTNPAYKQGTVLMTLFYREGFEKFNKGYASAIVLYTFVIIAIFTAIQFIAEKKLVHYE